MLLEPSKNVNKRRSLAYFAVFSRFLKLEFHYSHHSDKVGAPFPKPADISEPGFDKLPYQYGAGEGGWCVVITW